MARSDSHRQDAPSIQGVMHQFDEAMQRTVQHRSPAAKKPSCESRLKAKDDALQQERDALRDAKAKAIDMEQQAVQRESHAANKESIISQREQKVKKHEDAVRSREDAAQKREDAVHEREREVEQRGLEIQSWHEIRRREQQQKGSNLAAFSAAYHVHVDRMIGESFSKLVGSVQELTALPDERFVDANDDQQYPLVLLFSTSGIRLEQVIDKDEVRRCRKMVAPGGQLVLLTFRVGVGATASMEPPDGVDNLIQLTYNPDTEPYMLLPGAKSEMNKKSVPKLKQIVSRLVPPPPVMGNAWLFGWLSTPADWLRKFRGDEKPGGHGEL